MRGEDELQLKRFVKRCAHILPDKAFLSLRYFLTFRRFPNWKDPKSYNEKIQWLKLYDRDPRYGEMVDKAAVKNLVSRMIGPEYLIPTLGVWDRPEDVDFDALPDRFVLKCTHDSGSVVLCPDKEKLDRQGAMKILHRGMARNYYKEYREWPYRDVPRRILAEVYLNDGTGPVPSDYKVMCFQGEPKLVILHQGRFGKHTMDFYDTDWNRMRITRVGQARSETDAPRPECLEKMLELSGVLSRGIPHLRVDWYICGGKLYLGELTFYNNSGFGPFVDPRDDELLGSWIRLPEKPKKG